MGTLFSALDIARSGMQVAQIQLDVTAHNIANVATPGFSRQRAELSSLLPLARPYGNIGRGVQVTSITRQRDVFLDVLFRDQVSSVGFQEQRLEFINQVEDIFLEPGENGFTNRLNQFFSSLEEFANNVEELPVRQSVLNEATALAETFQNLDSRLNLLRTNANEEVEGLVNEINSLSKRIAAVNEQIRRLEASGSAANDLRDQREALLDELAGLVNVTYRERDNGMVDVLVSGDVLVDGDRARLLEAVRDPSLDPERNDLFSVQFVDNGAPLRASDGQLAGVLEIRDSFLADVQTQLDTLAAGIIEQINSIHSQGRGLAGLTTATSSNVVADPAAALAGLPFPVTDGSFEVHRFDAAGNPLGTITVNVTAGVTSLDDIAAQLAPLGATVNPDGTLTVSAPAGESFAFASDSSGALAALGLDGLFVGTDAGSIGVNPEIAANPELLSSGFSTDLSETGDNQAALALAEVRNAPFFDGGTATVNDAYESLIVDVGIAGRDADDRLEVEQQFSQNVDGRRLEVSGVDLNEETVNLLVFQRAFEASARVVSVTDRMLESLLNIVR